MVQILYRDNNRKNYAKLSLFNFETNLPYTNFVYCLCCRVHEHNITSDDYTFLSEKFQNINKDSVCFREIHFLRI